MEEIKQRMYHIKRNGKREMRMLNLPPQAEQQILSWQNNTALSPSVFFFMALIKVMFSSLLAHQ